MFALLLKASSDLPIWLQETQAWAAVFQGFVTPILIFIGGVFAWWKFFRQGEHDPRLQPSVTGTAGVHGDTVYVLATTTVQNNGRVDVELSDEASALEVYTTAAEDEDWRQHSTTTFSADRSRCNRARP